MDIENNTALELVLIEADQDSFELAERLRNHLDFADGDHLDYMADSHPFESEDQYTAYLVATSLMATKPEDFAQLTGVSTAAAVHIYERLLSTLVVSLIDREEQGVPQDMAGLSERIRNIREKWGIR